LIIEVLKVLANKQEPGADSHYGFQENDLLALKLLHQDLGRVEAEISKIIVGQKEVVRQLLVALLVKGHCLLMGVPGLAKTLLVRTLAQCLGLSNTRIQFTPDLMPSDITGTELLQEDQTTRQRVFRFMPGPIFANIVLADEINRTPPKTQSALLEAMQELQVTVAGNCHRLPDPFFVLATQNPIEQEGTYPLPEAQLDRFMFLIHMNYPSADEELEIITRTTSPLRASIQKILGHEQLAKMQELVSRIPVSGHVVRYAMELVRATRPKTDVELNPCEQVAKYVNWGAGPRAGQALVLAGKAGAALDNRCHVTTQDIRMAAHSVLRHRIVPNYHAEADGVTADDIIDALLESVRVEVTA
jgi:MoxR-like ATPase